MWLGDLVATLKNGVDVREQLVSYQLQASDIIVQVTYKRAGALGNGDAYTPDTGFRELKEEMWSGQTELWPNFCSISTSCHSLSQWGWAAILASHRLSLCERSSCFASTFPITCHPKPERCRKEFKDTYLQCTQVDIIQSHHREQCSFSHHGYSWEKWEVPNKVLGKVWVMLKVGDWVHFCL